MAKKRKQRRSPDTGTIRKVGTRYKASYRNPAGGYWTRRCDTLAEAEAWLAGFAARKEAGAALEGGQQTLGAWLQRWLNSRPKHLKPTTLQDYAYKLGMLAVLAGVRLVDLMPDPIDDCLAEIAETQAESTARQVRGLLVRALEEAHRRRYILSNPARGERTSRAPRAEPVRLAAPQVRVLCTDDGFYAAAWPLLSVCGMRAGEVCGLRLTDVDLDACTISIRQQVTDLRGTAITQTPKTPASVRTIPMPRAYAPVLAAHLERLERRARQGLKRGTWQEHGLIFPGKSGRPLNPTSLRHALHDATDALRLPPVKTHELRHTAGGLLESLDAPEHIIRGILGHGPKVITRHYAPPSVDTMRPWVDRVWALVWPERERGRQAE